MRRLLAVGAVLALLAGCGSDEGGDVTADDLDGNTYASTEVVGDDYVPGSTITLAFEDGRLGVQAGCNTMTAEYDLEDTLLTWSGEPASTMMACSDELTAQDAWLTGLFTEGVDAALEDDILTLTQGDQTIELAAAGD